MGNCGVGDRGRCVWGTEACRTKACRTKACWTKTGTGPPRAAPSRAGLTSYGPIARLNPLYARLYHLLKESPGTAIQTLDYEPFSFPGHALNVPSYYLDFCCCRILLDASWALVTLENTAALFVLAYINNLWFSAGEYPLLCPDTLRDSIAYKQWW